MPWTKLVADELNTSKTENGNRIISYGEAIKEALSMAMELDSNVVILGEGIDAAGYAYETTSGLSERFGKIRVIETPIAEQLITGVTLGLSIVGVRPILVHMRNDFLLVSMDQIVNHINHWKTIFGNNTPLVIRAIIARGWGSGAQHAQSFHALFSMFEGIDVVMPYSPYDAKGMLLKAIASNRPILFLEHRWLYNDKCHVPEEAYLINIDKAKVLREGNDLTIVTMSIGNRYVDMACDNLVKENINAEHIDIVSANPIDIQTIIKSVCKTGRLLIVENGPVCMGVNCEIAKLVYYQLYEKLLSPIETIGWKGSTVPSGTKLEENFYFTENDIIEKAKAMLSKTITF